MGYRFPKRLGIASLGVSNLLDEHFQYQDDSFREFGDRPSIGPYLPDRRDPCSGHLELLACGIYTKCHVFREALNVATHKATFLVQARRSAWPRVFAVMLSCAVAALALDSATAAFARMGENAATTKLELTPEDDTVQQFCKLGDACGDDSALTGNFRGIWRNATFSNPTQKLSWHQVHR